jgi:hypothetical protein
MQFKKLSRIVYVVRDGLKTADGWTMRKWKSGSVLRAHKLTRESQQPILKNINREIREVGWMRLCAKQRISSKNTQS